MNKFRATFVALALAPLSALVVTTVIESINSGWPDVTASSFVPGLFYIATFTYVISAGVGLPAHLALVYFRKTDLSNYAMAGALPMVLVTILMALATGHPPAQWTVEGLKVAAFFGFNGLVVAAVFGWIYSTLVGSD